jgi:6-phosphogluconolactonase
MTRHIPASIALVCCFLLAIPIASALISARAASASKHFVYFGTYTDHGSQGLYVSAFDASSGTLASPALAVAAANPTFLVVAPSRRFLYAINELDQFRGQPVGAVSAYSIDSASGKLTLLNQVSSLGPGPAFIGLDQGAKFLLVANYSGGSVAVFRLLPDGRIGESTAFVQHHGSSVNTERQEGPHAHATAMSPDNRFVLVADLGIDQLVVYPFDASHGTLGQAQVVKTEAGAGPRHLTFAASGKFLYVINEMASTVTVYSYHPADGALTPIEKVALLPTGFTGISTAAEVVIHPSGKFLYASNRGDDSVAVFGVDPNQGTLTLIEHVKTGGKTPRSFAIDPSGEWLIAANQDSSNVFTFRINRESGRLTSTGYSIEVSSPAMVDFVTLEGRK